MAILSSVACLLLVLFLHKKEKMGKTLFTPVFSLGFIYSIIMILVSVYDLFFDDHYKMIAKVPLLSMLFILEFWIIGKLVMKLFKIKKDKVIEYYQPKYTLTYCANFYIFIKLALTVALIILLVDFFGTYGFAVGDSGEIKSHYSNGIIGHLVNIISALLLAVSTARKPIKLNVFLRFISILWVFVLALANAKYSMFMYAFALLIIYTINYPKKFTFVKIIIYVGIIAIAFFVVYILRFLISDESLSTIPYEFIFHHFIYYISGGYYAFSTVLEFGATPTPGVGAGVFFATILNIISLFRGQEFVSSTSAFINVRLPGGYEQTNVYTLFGAIWLEMGFGGVILCVAILAVLAYTVYSIFLRANNKIMTSLHSYVMATLVFGFFNCFYGMLNIWELIGISFVIVLAYDIFCVSTKKSVSMQKFPTKL